MTGDCGARGKGAVRRAYRASWPCTPSRPPSRVSSSDASWTGIRRDAGPPPRTLSAASSMAGANAAGVGSPRHRGYPMNYKSELRRLRRLLRADHEAYLDELDRPWSGMDEDLALAVGILLKHAATSGGRLPLLEACDLLDDPREEATVTLPPWSMKGGKRTCGSGAAEGGGSPPAAPPASTLPNARAPDDVGVAGGLGRDE